MRWPAYVKLRTQRKGRGRPAGAWGAVHQGRGRHTPPPARVLGCLFGQAPPPLFFPPPPPFFPPPPPPHTHTRTRTCFLHNLLHCLHLFSHLPELYIFIRSLTHSLTHSLTPLSVQIMCRHMARAPCTCGPYCWAVGPSWVWARPLPTHSLSLLQQLALTSRHEWTHAHLGITHMC